MRFFLCAFKYFYAAIPSHCVSSLMLYSDDLARYVEQYGQNGNTYFSLPHLFNLSEKIRHGIVLKNSHGTDDSIDTHDVSSIKNRTILLTPAVERETDIPEPEIFSVPKSLAAIKSAAIFSGIQFISDARSLIIFLNTEKMGALYD